MRLVFNLLCLLLLALLAQGQGAPQLPTTRSLAPRVLASRLPVLAWEERSDWVNVKTDVSPPAVGDGVADDTAAIEKALAGVRDGSTLYFPAGTYRITRTLKLLNPDKGQLLGVALIGRGRDTKLVWGGEVGGRMLHINGAAYSRFIGLNLDGRGKAAVGFYYNSDRAFQTENIHRHLAFRNFTDAGVLDDPVRALALAEVSFENCLFEDSRRGVVFLQFNNYNFTFDCCEFRRCDIGIENKHGNFYARNCHFEKSRVTDISDHSEHGSSIRRCTSTGSNAFLVRKSIVAPLTIQDCRVASWKSIKGAIAISSPPVLLFDCVFSKPPLDAQGVATAPIRFRSNDQRLIVSNNLVVANNTVGGARGLIQAGPQPQLYEVPAGKRKGIVKAATQSFFRDTARVPGNVFDAKRDFGAKGDGTTDDTDAVQKTIDAARARSNKAIAYLPSGRYVISRTLKISGSNYFVGGSGFMTQLKWQGAKDGTMLEVQSPQQVSLENIDVGSHNVGETNNAIDIHQIGARTHFASNPRRSSFMTYDNVIVFGTYQAQPLHKGVRFTNLGAGEVVVMAKMSGNQRFVDSAQATVLGGITYEGSIVVEGKDKRRGGFLGFQTRLATHVTHGLYLRDSHSIVMSDFYMEQSDNNFLFSGAADDPPGRATIQAPKIHMLASQDPAKNTFMDIRNYQGQIFFGPGQLYVEPKKLRIKQQGGPLSVFLWGVSFYDAALDVQSQNMRLSLIGNGGTTPPADAGALTPLSLALDDLRRLGEVDVKLSYSTPQR